MDKEQVATALNAAFTGDWKQYPAHHAYWFSASGLCASVRERRYCTSFVLLRGCASGFGYRAVSMPDGGGRYFRVYIHRAVCELFNGPAPDGLRVVRHLDCDMTNNAASNLAWGTDQDNANDAIRNGRVAKGERNGAVRLTQSLVDEMRRERRDKGTSYKALAARFGVATMTAYRVVKEQSWN